MEIASKIRTEQDRRTQSFELQQKVTKAQLDFIKAKTKKISDGDALIKVEANNLSPALELIFTEILERAQVRASEEGLEFLVGL